MEKLEFIIPKPKQAETNSRVCRVGKNFYDLVQLISHNTRESAVDVTERIAEYLTDKIEFIEVRK